MNKSTLIIKNKRQTPWRIIIIAWLAVFFFNVARNFIATSVNGISLNWELYLASSVVFFGLWIVTTPLVLRLAKRFRLDRVHWLKNSIILLFAGAILGYTISVLHELFRHYVFPQYVNTSLRFMLGTGIYVLEYNLLLYAVIVGAYNTVEYFKRYREELDRAAELRTLLARSELMTLKMQLHPHFLFNTHHSIVGLMTNGETEKAILMLVKLSDLMRATLDHSDQNEIRLKQELELISLYLSIQCIRFEDRLKITQQISEETLNAFVPSFILQPIIENSIKHGIALRSGSGYLSLNVRKEMEFLIMEINDDGSNIKLKDGRPEHEGIGIHTTRSRLEQSYGKNFELTFSNLKDYGVNVKIKIPYYETPRFNN